MLTNADDLREAETEDLGKLIEISLQFWTNDIADGRGHIVPKHAWASGVVRIRGNELHGIAQGEPKAFDSLLDIGSAIEEALIEQGIILHPGRKMSKYLPEYRG